MIISIWGIITWKTNKSEIKEESDTDYVLDSIFKGSLVFIFVTLSIQFHLHTSNPLPVLDSLAATLSMGAMYLMLKKKRNCWLYWIAADLVYVYIFLSQRLFLSASLYVLFLYLAANGYKQWKLDEKV